VFTPHSVVDRGDAPKYDYPGHCVYRLTNNDEHAWEIGEIAPRRVLSAPRSWIASCQRC